MVSEARCVAVRSQTSASCGITAEAENQRDLISKTPTDRTARLNVLLDAVFNGRLQVYRVFDKI